MTPWISSAGALVLGLVLSLGMNLPLPKGYRALGKWLLQISIVFLGFAMDPSAVWRAGVEGIAVTAVSLAVTMGVGLFLAKRLGLASKLGTLITVGTAICGGSAIAAVGPVIRAKSEEMSVALAVVFLLNATALVLFPWIGHGLGLSPREFGLLAAIAIHDTSSVVGAATAFSDLSVPVAVTVKLTRALWIVPLTFAVALSVSKTNGEKRKLPTIPWFIAAFVVAVIFRAVFPQFESFYSGCGLAGKAGLKGAIFLISAQLTRTAAKEAGPRALGLAVALWSFVTIATVLALRQGLLG